MFKAAIAFIVLAHGAEALSFQTSVLVRIFISLQ
jgi:hypothetical protein